MASISLSTTPTTTYECPQDYTKIMADVNGDGYDDLICYLGLYGSHFLYYADASGNMTPNREDRERLNLGRILSLQNWCKDLDDQ